MKRYWNKFLNWVIPNRREKILIKMIKQDQELGLYDEPFNTQREMKTKYRVKCYGNDFFQLQHKTFWGWEDLRDWSGGNCQVYFLTLESALERIEELNKPKPKITYEYPLQ